MKTLIALLIFASLPAFASTATETVRDELVKNLEFINGYAETIGLRDGDLGHSCAAFASIEIAGQLQIGIADGDFHASYNIGESSLVEINRAAKIIKIQDQVEPLSIVIDYSSGLRIAWTEKDPIFGFIPRTLRTRCE